MTTRLTLQNQIYEILQKTSTAYGLYTPAKVQAMIDDSLAYISSKMMKVNQGWLTQRTTLNIVADAASIALPSGCAMINFLKIKRSTDSTNYVPLPFLENHDGATNTESSTADHWRFVAGAIYLEPPPDTSVTGGILCEYTAFPAALSADGTSLDAQLDLSCFVNYAKFRAASQLYSLGSDGNAPWSRYENEWAEVCTEMIARRFREPTPIKSFSNY